MDSLTLMDMSDLEVLHVVDDVQDELELSSTHDIAMALGFPASGKGKHDGHNSVGARMAWLVRWGACERVGNDGKQGGSVWRIKSRGRALMYGRLTKAQEEQIEKLASDSMPVALRAVARRWRAADSTAATLSRREFRRGTA